MTGTENTGPELPAIEPWVAPLMELRLQVEQLQAETRALEQENKSLRLLVEKVIANRLQSHSELVVLVSTIVTKLSISDVGILVSRLVEHNNSVAQFLTSLLKGHIESVAVESSLIRSLDQAKRDLAAAVTPLAQELTRLEAPFEPEMLEELKTNPEAFFSVPFARARRCFVKGQVPREKILRVFGEEALPLFNDMTTDPKLNARPKPDEIVLAFKSDFETALPASSLPAPKQEALLQLFRRVQSSKGNTTIARAQKNTFQKLSFVIELLHYYHHQNTEPADVIFAQRLPVLVEQLVLSGPGEQLEENLVIEAETLLAFIVTHDHRLMVINNIGKGGGTARTLKLVLRLRADKVPDLEQIVPDFIKHIIPVTPQKPPAVPSLTALLKLVPAEAQRVIVKSIMSTDRMRKEEGEALAKALVSSLGLTNFADEIKLPTLSPEVERQVAWGQIKEMISSRTDPSQVAAAIRHRLHARYDADEMKQSWVTLTEADPIAVIRVFSQLPFLPDGKTDPIARPLMETYVTRLVHEKYAATYGKILNSLRSMFRAKPDSPTLVNFVALVKWVSPEAAQKICADVGMVMP